MLHTISRVSSDSPENNPSMTIRFSCKCGAIFEVPDDKAGLTGRCRKCGEEMPIPNVSETVDDNRDISDVIESIRDETPDSDHISEVPAEPETGAPPDSETVTETNRERYCPYCGREVVTQTPFCPHCLKSLKPPASPGSLHHELTHFDWFLITVLAPMGLVGGFVSLVMGNRKGLNMIAISTATILLSWLIFVLLGWIQ